MKLEVELIRLCPYCKKRPIKRKSTCGHMRCQYKHHIRSLRKYWNNYHRKTDRTTKKRINL